MAESKGGKSELPDSGGKEADNLRFPSDLVDPEEKSKKEYLLRYFRTAHNLHKRNGGLYGTDRRSDFITNRMYADGNQSNAKYINALTRLKDKQTNRPLSYMNLDWSIFTVLPKVVDVIMSKMEKIDHDIFVDAINPLASMDREQAKAQLWAKSLLAPFFQEMSQKAGVNLNDPPGDFIPETMEELEAYMGSGFRLPYESAFEMAIQGIFYQNKWKDESRMIRKDLVVNGCAGGCVDVDPVTKAIYMRYCDPVNMLLMDFRGHDGSQMARIGEYRRMRISEIKVMAGDQFTEEDYYKMAQAYVGYWNNPLDLIPFADYINTDIQYGKFRDYDTCEVYVLDMDFDSLDVLKFKEKKKTGMPTYTFREKFSEKNYSEKTDNGDGTIIEKKVYSKEYKTVYSGKWIVGTDMMYDYGKLANISRPAYNPKECYKRFKFYRVANRSQVERIIPLCDSLHLTWLKVQNLKARAMPSGMSIEIGAFDNVFLDGKKMTAKELLEMAVQSGIIVWRKNNTADDDGGDQTGKPVEPWEGGMGREFGELLNSMMSDIAMIREISGINEAADGTLPSPEQPVGTSKIALEGANNSIFPIAQGFLTLQELMVKDIICKIQLIVKYTGNFNVMSPTIGNTLSKYIQIGVEGSAPYIFNLRCESRPTEEMKRAIVQAATDALKSTNDPSKGGIEYPDYLQIVRMVDANYNLKMIEMTLDQKIRKYKKEAQAEANENIKTTADANAQSGAAIEAAKQKTMAFESQLKKDEYTHQIDEDIRYLKAEQVHAAGSDVLNSHLKREEDVNKNLLESKKVA